MRNRLQLLLLQIDQHALAHRLVLHWRGDVVRKAAAMALTTPEPRFILAVRGHWHRWLDQIEQLAPAPQIGSRRVPQGARRSPNSAQEAGTAHHLWVGHALKRGSRITGLPAKFAPAGCARRFRLLGQPVR